MWFTDWLRGHLFKAKNGKLYWILLYQKLIQNLKQTTYQYKSTFKITSIKQNLKK